jgi:hypothetical protein
MQQKSVTQRICTMMAIVGVCLLLANDFAFSSPKAKSIHPYSSSNKKAISLDNSTEEIEYLYTFGEEDPTKEFNQKDYATKEYPIIINRNIINLEPGQKLSVLLPEQIFITIVHEKTFYHSGNSVTLIGFLTEFDKRHRTSITFNDDAIRGKIITPDGIIRLAATSVGGILIDQRDSNRIPVVFDDDTLLPVKPESEEELPPKRMASLGDTTIDLMILYTIGLANNYPGSQLAARLNELVAIANTAYSDSEVYITLNLVHTAQVSYSDTVSNSTALNQLTNGESVFSGVDSLRTAYGADLVALVRPFSSSHSTCGLAWLNGAEGWDISLYADTGYASILDGEYSGGSTVYYCSDLTLTHELGHNMGCNHDRAHSSGTGAYTYSYGYGIEGTFGTIMSYMDPEMSVFSNPVLSCNGYECGIDENLSNSANNALSLNNTRDAIAAFKATVTCPNDPSNDSDGDGICGDLDNCPSSFNADQVDTDNDGAGDVCDDCPTDPSKIFPEVCGCWILDNDSDNDGILNCVEDQNLNSTIDIGETDPHNLDTDGDGIQDGTELGYTALDIGPDTDRGIFVADLDPLTQTDPLLLDTDADGKFDGDEDANYNGKVDGEESDPLNQYDPCSLGDYFVVHPHFRALASSDTDRVVFFDASQSLCYKMVSCQKEIRVCAGVWDFGGEGDIVGGNGYDILVFRYDTADEYLASLTMTEQNSGTAATDNLSVTAEIVETPLPDLNIGSSINNTTVTLAIIDPELSDAAVESIIVFWGDRYRTEHAWPPSVPIEHTYTRTGTDYNIRVKTLNAGGEEFNYTSMYDEDLMISIL